MKTKKSYEKPCAERISFHIDEGLMTEVDIYSTGGGDLPWLSEETNNSHPYQLD